MSFSSCAERISSDVGFRIFSLVFFLVREGVESVAWVSALPGAGDFDSDTVGFCDVGLVVVKRGSFFTVPGFGMSFLGSLLFATSFFDASFLDTSFFPASFDSSYRGAETESDLCHCAA
jgi:hypothetical protein